MPQVLIHLIAGAEKLDVTKQVNILFISNNLKTKVDYLHVVKSFPQTVPIDFKKIRNVADNEVVKIKKINRLKAKLNNLDQKIPDATALIQINQYNSDNQNLEKKTFWI